MKKQFLRTVATLLTVVLFLISAPLNGFVGLDWLKINFAEHFEAQADSVEIILSGSCSENISYTLDSDGLLIISGTGAMQNYTVISASPFYAIRESIKNVIIKEGITSIGSNSFYMPKSLESISIPSTLTLVEKNALRFTSSLNAVYIDDIKTWCNINFANEQCNPLYYAHNLYLNSELVTDLIIPSTVEHIKDFCFYNCTSIKSISFEKGVKSVGNYVFSNCSNLSYISFNDDLTSIGISAFYNCHLLSNFTLPKKLETIGAYAFYNCLSITNVILPEYVKNIGKEAFYYGFLIEQEMALCCITLLNKNCDIFEESSTFPENAVICGHIDSTAQTYAEKYTRTFISIDKNSLDIIDAGYCGDYADYELNFGGVLTINGSGELYKYNNYTDIPWHKYKGYIKSIIINEGIETLTAAIFNNCGNLKSVILPTSLKDIQNNVFANCYSMQSINIPDSIKSIGDYAFNNCKSLKEIKLGENISSIGKYSFANCILLQNIQFNNKLTVIGDYAFACSNSLEHISLPNSIINCGNYVFYSCFTLKNITIGSGISKLTSSFFNNCTSLEKVTILNPNCLIDDTNTTIPTNCKIIGYDNSTARSYARKYNRTFELIDCTHSDANADGLCDLCKNKFDDALSLGDIDNDENITSSDARTTLRAAVGLDVLTEAQQKAADVNKDGEITSSDARSILRCAVGLETF